MSYNYLPLDRKWLNFQQVKNLLDYNQLVSITFDAHERIVQCTDYLNTIPATPQPELSEVEPLRSNIVGSGEEVHVDIVKLMTILKIKSLSYGHSGVQIETVKRLMEMYNNDVFPVIYTRSAFGSVDDTDALSQLSFALAGLGEVYYKGQKMQCSKLSQKLNWEPLNLQNKEWNALTTGTQFTTARAMYSLKKAERLLKTADLIAALSFDAFGCSLDTLHPGISTNRSRKSEIDTAAAISKYLAGSSIKSGNKATGTDPSSFKSTSGIHDSAKSSFDYVLSIFLKAINTVSEQIIIFPGENLVLNRGNLQIQPLTLAANFLSAAMNEVGIISERRITQLASGERGLPLNAETDGTVKNLQYKAVEIVSENKQASAAASLNSMSVNANNDYVSLSSNAASICLKIIGNLEKLLAIELTIGIQALESRRPVQTSPVLQQLLQDFRQQFPLNEEAVSAEEIDNVAAFLNSGNW